VADAAEPGVLAGDVEVDRGRGQGPGDELDPPGRDVEAGQDDVGGGKRRDGQVGAERDGGREPAERGTGGLGDGGEGVGEAEQAER
jgi:hypothetical protein